MNKVTPPHIQKNRYLIFRRALFAAFFFLIFTPNLHAQDNVSKELEGIFISGSVHQMFAVGELSQYVQPKPGWRAGLGYNIILNEKHSFPIFVESGYSFVSGTNPLVRTFDIVPVVGYAGYTFSPLTFLDLFIQIGAGGYFAKVDHYETAIDLAEGNLVTTMGNGLIVGAKLGAGVSLFERSLEIHLNGTVECILERDGPVPLPGASISITLYPVKIYSVISRSH